MSHVVGQAEMFVAPATRTMIVPAGRECWWGVDPSSGRVAIATFHVDGRRQVYEHPFARLVGPQRLSTIYADTRSLALGLCVDGLQPGLVFVEQPSGKAVNLELVFAVGAIMAGLYDGVLAGCATGPARFESAPPSWWKKRSIGRGDIYKPKGAGAADRYDILRWAWQDGMPVEISSWDCADAWGMAAAIRKDVALDAR